MKRRYFIIVVGIVLLFSVFFVYRHPILLEWMTGKARIIGFPIRADVYADGEIDKRIRIFRCDKYRDGPKADFYILYLLSPYSFKTKHIISLDLQEKYAGVPAVTDKNAFDLVFGILFQSESATQFQDFRDQVTGYGFDPQLNISGNTVLFRIPSKQKAEPSMIRIEFSE
jgi:hypothetical protein